MHVRSPSSRVVSRPYSARRRREPLRLDGRRRGRLARPLQPARGRPARRELDERRLLRVAAARTRTGSAGGSGSRGGGRDGSGTSPGQRLRQRARAVGVRHRADQRLGVRVQRRRPELLRRRASRRSRPRYMTATVSATWRTIARSCEMSSRPSSSSRASAASRFAICACAEASSEASGSSSTITDGFAASARAIAIRCRWPPENSCG